MAKAVACGGCACTQALAAGWRFMMPKWVFASLVRLRVPASWLPSRSTRHMSSGFMKPLEMSVGVQSARLSPTRMVMLPPLPST
jgi:hypothetical protein